jgi:hypothetical protein
VVYVDEFGGEDFHFWLDVAFLFEVVLSHCLFVWLSCAAVLVVAFWLCLSQLISWPIVDLFTYVGNIVHSPLTNR